MQSIGNTKPSQAFGASVRNVLFEAWNADSIPAADRDRAIGTVFEN